VKDLWREIGLCIVYNNEDFHSKDWNKEGFAKTGKFSGEVILKSFSDGEKKIEFPIKIHVK